MSEKRVSIQLIGYSAERETAEAIRMVLAQQFSGSLEFNICDTDGRLQEERVLEALKAENISVHPQFCRQPEDCFGVLAATGEYIALCLVGEKWIDEKKLEKQISALSENGCMLVTHDAEILKGDGFPVDQNVRSRYIRQLGYEDRRYGVEQLQRFAPPGLTGTWMFRNIFREASQRDRFLKSGLRAEIRISAMLVCQGHGTNLADERMTACQMDEEACEERIFPKYQKNDVQAKKEELEELRQLAAWYGIELDPSYQMLCIANGAFNALAEAEPEPTQELVDLFMALYREVYREEYDIAAADTAEKGFFLYLRRKMQKYELNKGTEVTLPLAECFRNVSDSKRADFILACKGNKPFLRQALLEQAADSQAVLSRISGEKHGRLPKRLKKISASFRWKSRKLLKRTVLRRLRKRGFSSYMANEWFETVFKNLLHDHDTPLQRKLWCYRRGFMPWRIEQYGLTEDNFQEFLSDRDYMYLHQMNNSYKKWIEDKMTLRYVLEPFRQHLPEYYFQIIQRDDRQLLLKLPDCPDGYDATFDELFRLLREKGKLAFKSASGTHGIGFYKAEFRDGQYYLNNAPVTEYRFRKTIDRFKSFYIVTEYVNMHDDIKKIYSGAVNTIRVMTLNRDGHHPQIMDAYMRIGSVKSGVTDNVAYGGVVCSIDVETGRYSGALQLVDHVYISIDRHPDTDTVLQGTVPHWELIKRGLQNICTHIPQLEYLGFDVVCTPKGFTILEINSHQDLHRFPCYNQCVKDFYFYKLRRKERRYHIKRK